MIQSNISHVEELISEISPLITNNRIKELLISKPKIEIEVYKKTAIFSALKEYEDKYELSPAIPHAFYAILEQELELNGFLKTLKKYDDVINLIINTMNLDKKYFIEILKILRASNNEKREEQLVKRQELKEIIRKATSKFKEGFVKERVDAKIELLMEHTNAKSTKQSDHILDITLFERIIMGNKNIKESLKSIISEKTDIRINDQELVGLIRNVLTKEFTTTYAELLNIQKPRSYQKYLDNKALTRVQRNDGAKLNKLLIDESHEIKNKIVTLINLKTTIEKNNITNQNNDVLIAQYYNIAKELKSETSKNLQVIIEQITTIIRNTNIIVVLNSRGEIEFQLATPITPDEKTQCKIYETNIKKTKTIHHIIFNYYIKQNESIKSLTKQSSIPLSINENQYEVDVSYWLTKDKIMAITNAIDTNILDKMPNSTFDTLKKFLLEDGLLWAYIADNIDLITFSNIINNFEEILATIPKEKIDISNLHEIIKCANTTNYINDLIIGLVGREIATKVINYNQFCGVTVTDEIIQKRLRKLVDLAVRSEYITKSSLPFRCDVQLDGYQLQRYRNNNPEIFTSGIDTKTCFFISVNENDFFFYSLLNKNGFVLKIVNNKGELVARASCFRKNNILMINGIRCKNNKVYPESLEETEEMKKIVDLIELFAQKIIERTVQDECPIDYVVCNKAGILENAIFEDRFEQINFDLFKEPINIYDDDWQEFIHLYDGQEQLLQEVPYAPNKSFTTDFGNHFPALLIRSRDNRALLSPRDIAYNDQPATYTRPKREIEEYIGLEITDEILQRINRIKALSCFIGTEEEQLKKQKEYTLLQKSDIKSIELGDDWYILIKNDDTIENVHAKKDNEIKNITLVKKN